MHTKLSISFSTSSWRILKQRRRAFLIQVKVHLTNYASFCFIFDPEKAKANGFEVNGRSRRTLVHDLFEGTLTSETRCLTCETVSSRDESFLDLSIDIEPHSSVTACLRQFSASEMLCQRNKFSCDACSGLQEAEKRMKVKKLPNVLALHLKRFKYQEETQKFIKLTYRVAFPFELRLFNTVDDAENADRLYELFAIVVHIGNGPHHGHYTTIIRSQSSWFLYDDDNVESIKETEIPKYFGESSVGAGYVLFYQAVDMNYTEVGLPEPASSKSSLHKVVRDDITLAASSNTEPQIAILSESSKSGTGLRSRTLPADGLFAGKDAILSSLSKTPASPTFSRDDTTDVTPIRHSKSEKDMAKQDARPDQPLPPLPLPIKRPKTGDGAPLGHRKSWLTTLGRNQSKRSHDSPSSFNHAHNEHAIPPQQKHSHTRSQSTSHATITEEKDASRLDATLKAKPTNVDGGNMSSTRKTQVDGQSAKPPQSITSKSPDANFSSTRFTPSSPSSNTLPFSFTRVSPDASNTAHPPSSFQQSQQQPHLSSAHALMSPFKRAARKMSMSLSKK